MIKKMIRKLIRIILRVRKYENINSAIDRKKVKIQKKFYKRPILKSDLKTALVNLGITEGDNLMVHASWRQFYNFKGEPKDVIEILMEILGDEGTLLMPSYGPDRTFFDINKTPSNAGVLSEVFRLLPNTYRSACTHFSVCAIGKKALEFTSEHFNSKYGFDNFSPYYKFANTINSKILFMGLGKEPTTISLFHCAGYILKNKIPYFENLLSYRYTSTLIINNKKYKKDMVTRKPEYKNNNKIFKKIFRSIKNRNHIKISNLDLVIIDANEGLKKAIEFAERGIYCYKRRLI